MLQIIGLLLPLFALIAMGRLAIQRGLLDRPGLDALTGFTYWVALPALLFSSIADSRAPDVVEVAAIYLLCCIVVFFAACALSFVFYGRSVSRAAVFGLNSTYGNVIYLGTPVIASVFGSQGVSLILAIIAFHSGVLLPLASVLIELDNPQQGGARAVGLNTAKGLLRNPIIMSIALGFLWRATGYSLPAPVMQFCKIIAPAASPLALFCLGASLPSITSERSIIMEATVAMTLKLAVLPACVALVSWRMGLSGLPWNVAVVTASMPTGVNVFMLARRATTYAETSAVTIVMASMLSVVTLAVLLTWITHS